MRPVARTGLPSQRYHAAHCVSSQLSLLKSVLAYNTWAEVYAGAVEFILRGEETGDQTPSETPRQWEKTRTGESLCRDVRRYILCVGAA